MEKLHNVRGRISYISSHAKQENLYAVYETINRHYWTELARFNQQEFLKSGTDGKCIEARELIIALPESFPELYNPDWLLQLFTNRFKEEYGVECVSALHHNKRKTNYHIHLIFSERKMLEQPVEKVATRNMFYNEQKKHVRTKKEILDEKGNIRKGCRIIKKGEVYERTLFENKNKLFKQEAYVDEAKHFFTQIINSLVLDEKERLKVFEKEGLYLATKKIGKNNPKAEQIKADNEVRMRWNQEVDRAIVSEVPEDKIRQIKQEYITERVKHSIEVWGRKPELLSGFITTATMCLALLISEVLKAARELKNRLFHETLEREYGRKIDFTKEIYGESDTKEHTEDTVYEFASDSKEEIIHSSKPAVIPTPKEIPEIKEIPKPQIPSKPFMPPIAAFYPKYKKIKAELDRMNGQIFDAEHEKAKLEIQRDDLRGIARLTKKGELNRQIAAKEEEISIRKTGFANTVRNHGFTSVKEFYDTLYASKEAYNEYMREERAWEEAYGEKPSKAETLTERLQRYQKKSDRQYSEKDYKGRDKGAR